MARKLPDEVTDACDDPVDTSELVDEANEPGMPPAPTDPDAATAAADPQFPYIADLSYEAARDELTSVVGRLESGQVGLEESVTLWQRGEALAAHCTAWLDGAEAAVAARTDLD